MSDNSKQLSWLDLLTVLSMILQVESYEQNLKQTSNDDLLNELQKQDQEYLDKILENQNKVINLLNDIASKLTN
jgi:hypothetical protein